MLTMFNMGLLGDFDRDVFESDASIMLFVAFMFLVVIVMLNVSRSAAVVLFISSLTHNGAPPPAPRRCSLPSSLIHTVGASSARCYVQM